MATKTETTDYEYGVPEMADYLGLAEPSVRIKLRNGNVKKASDGRYGWKTKKEMTEIADSLKSEKKTPAPKAKAEKPVKKAPKEKAAKAEKKAAPKKKAA